MSWRLARSIVALQGELDERWPDRTRPDWTIGDADHRDRASDHNPNAAGVVCAIDVRGRDVAGELWDHLLSSRDPRIKYVIHDRLIFNSTVGAWTPRTYSGSNPHRDHLHLSVGRGPSGASTRPDLYDDASPWGLTATTEVDVLRRGDEGAEVGYVQEQVNRILTGRHDTGPLTVDGVFGEDTERYVRMAQRRLKWDETGVVTAAFGDRMLHQVLARDMEHLDVVKRPTEAF